MDGVKELLNSDPHVMGGAVVFTGTRVPLQALIDYLAGGEPLEEFLIDFPGVSRESAIAVIEALGSNLNQVIHAAAS